ncbi:family S53 protease [Dentipellis sp. KUC8613]|nr:family S53 protease [Dentipellis sp. KUC8613]
MLVSSFALAYLSSVVFATPVISGALHVHERRDAPPVGYTMMGRPSDDHVLTLGMALIENNRDGLVERLYAVSTPDSPDYGNHLSKEDVEAMVAPAPSTVAAVKAWLTAHNLSAESVSPAGDWMSLNMTVKQANKLLAADYCAFADDSGRQTIRTLSYSIPPSLKKHLDFVHPTIGFPVPIVGGPTTMKHYSDADLVSQDAITTDSVPASCAKHFTPACAEALYGIPKRNATQTNNRLAVSGFLDQYASKSDLKTFLKRYRPDLPSSTTFTTKLIDDGKNYQSHPGIEANLDTQYTVGIASHVPTVFISVGNDTHDGVQGFLDIIHVLLKDQHLPQVLSTSYGIDESDLPTPLAQKLCHAYAQLGARGTSVLFSSGDGGVSGSQDAKCTTFVPTFPSTCPFVTSVGGTQGVNPEVAADLSAGGFSTIFSIPPYQSTAVASYLAKLKKTYKGRFNRTGRAYPDVSAAATNVSIVVKGKFGGVDGTSCAAPITASVFSLLNDELIAARKKPLGFLNPLIYAKPEAFKDIVDGSNPGCNTTGFPATKGWDPVTGVGRPVFHALKTTVGL